MKIKESELKSMIRNIIKESWGYHRPRFSEEEEQQFQGQEPQDLGYNEIVDIAHRVLDNDCLILDKSYGIVTAANSIEYMGSVINDICSSYPKLVRQSDEYDYILLRDMSSSNKEEYILEVPRQ